MCVNGSYITPPAKKSTSDFFHKFSARWAKIIKTGSAQMDISTIVIIGLPVLILTGSLHRILANAGIGKKAAVLFFLCTAALSLLPSVRVAGDVWIHAEGAFFCVAPAVYLAATKAYSYRFFILFSFVTLLGVLSAFLINSYHLPYFAVVMGAAILIAALILAGAGAPGAVAVLCGVYSAAQSIVQITTNIASRTVLFGDMSMASVCVAACLFLSYALYRPRGRHEKRRKNAQAVQPVNSDISEGWRSS
jgi:hypothetical protein